MRGVVGGGGAIGGNGNDSGRGSTRFFYCLLVVLSMDVTAVALVGMIAMQSELICVRW